MHTADIMPKVLFKIRGVGEGGGKGGNRPPTFRVGGAAPLHFCIAHSYTLNKNIVYLRKPQM